MKIIDILIGVKNLSIQIDDADSQIKLIIGCIVDDAAVGISNVDATEMYSEINREIEKI